MLRINPARRKAVEAGLEGAANELVLLEPGDLEGGAWLLAVVRRSVRLMEPAARAEAERMRHPGLAPEAISRILIADAASRAALAAWLTAERLGTWDLTPLLSARVPRDPARGPIGAQLVYALREKVALAWGLASLAGAKGNAEAVLRILAALDRATADPDTVPWLAPLGDARGLLALARRVTLRQLGSLLLEHAAPGERIDPRGGLAAHLVREVGRETLAGFAPAEVATASRAG